MGKIAIHYGDLCTSIYATMIFPADEEKARIFVGWHLSKGPLQDYATQYPLGQDTLFAVMSDAGKFAEIREEAGKKQSAGTAVGEVIKILWALICNDRQSASIDAAAPQVASLNAAYEVIEKWGSENDHKCDRSTFVERMGSFKPALHLWGAWSIRERKWKPVGGYTARLDARAFVTESETLKRELVSWNLKRPQPIRDLQGAFLDPYDGCDPLRMDDLGTGTIPSLLLPAEMVPTRKRRGPKPPVSGPG